MRIETREVTIYNYNELSEKSKEKVLNDYINFITEVVDFSTISKNSNLYKAYKKSEEMQTPWFFGSYYWEYDKRNILQTINQYEYLQDGSIYNIQE